MLQDKVLSDPCDKVILEGSLDQLMEKVPRKKLVDVCSRKVVREWLDYLVSISWLSKRTR